MSMGRWISHKICGGPLRGEATPTFGGGAGSSRSEKKCRGNTHLEVPDGNLKIPANNRWADRMESSAPSNLYPTIIRNWPRRRCLHQLFWRRIIDDLNRRPPLCFMNSPSDTSSW